LISVKSTVGEGTEFALSLPVAKGKDLPGGSDG